MKIKIELEVNNDNINSNIVESEIKKSIDNILSEYVETNLAYPDYININISDTK